LKFEKKRENKISKENKVENRMKFTVPE